MDLLIRTKTDVVASSFGGAPKEVTIKAAFDAAFALSVYSPDGRWIAITDKDGVDIVGAECAEPARVRVDQPGVTAAAFSPRGTFLLTWHRKKEDEANLQLWRVSDGALRAFWHLKSNPAELWPPIRWCSDESIAVRAGSDELHVYDGAFSSTTITHRLPLTGVHQAWVSPATADGGCLIVGFAPRSKSKPAACVSWAYPRVAEPAMARSLQADSARVEFSADGGYALLELSTSASADSYYGDSRLFLASRDGRLNAAIAHPKEGPVHDFAWSPKSDVFVVIGGKSPPVAALYTKTGALSHNFGAAAFNTVRFAPNGKVVLLAGFGNMSGNMAFIDVAKRAALGPTSNCQCVVNADWSPDSRWLLTGTTRPRLQVDNGYRIWDYRGRCVVHKPFDQLFTVVWRPVPPSSYTEWLAGWEKASTGAGEVDGAPGSSGGSATVASPPRPAGVYRPPGARGLPGGGVVSSLMSERYSGVDEASPPSSGVLNGGLPSVVARKIVGGLPLGAGPIAPLSASQKKKLKAAAKKAEGGAMGAVRPAGEDGEGEGEGAGAESESPAESALSWRNTTVQQGDSARAAAAASKAPPPAEVDDASLTLEETAKVLRKLVKKAKEIADLRAKVGAGEVLDAAQEAKVAGEAALVLRIAALTRLIVVP